MSDDGKQRLAKVLAARGIASRREAEKMIVDGQVTVNGQLATHPGHPVDPKTDSISVDGKQIPDVPRMSYYLLYKPKGYITTRSDPEGRRSIHMLLPELPARVEAVGRLDMNTEGALLLTNDGELAHRLAHPSAGVPKRYMVKVYRTPTEKTLERISKGVELEDGRTQPCKVRVVEATDAENAWIEITVTEGRNRLVRRIFALVGHPVSKLTRESFATISIRGMERGDLRALSAEEVRRLRDLADGTPASVAGRKSRPRKAGFAKPNEEWLKKRVDASKRRDKKKASSRGGAAR